MPRVEVGYNPQVELTQVTASPNIHTVQANQNVQGSNATQLIRQLGIAFPQVNNLYQTALQNEQNAAEQYANSLPAGELRKQIDNGEVPVTKSPLWAATVQHVAGENASREIFRAAEVKARTGEFQTEAQLNEFLFKQRDEVLAGKGNYEVAGFDKNWVRLKNRASELMVGIQSEKLVTEGMQQATTDLSNALYDVTGGMQKDLPANEKIGVILQKYDLHRTSGTLVNDRAAKEVMDGLVHRLAASGNRELVIELLKSKLPNNGPTVESMLGLPRADSLVGMATQQYSKVAQEASDASILAQARANTDRLVANRDGGAAKDVVLPQLDGSAPKIIKAKDLLAESVEKQIQADPKMPLTEQVRIYANNGVDNDSWKRELSTAVFNIGEINIDAQGKPTGQLLQPTVAALDKFTQIRQVSDSYAKSLVGDEAFKTLDKIQALREGGVPDPHQAAALVNQVNRRAMEPKTWGNIQKDVTAQMSNITNPSMFTGRFWGEMFRGEFGEGDKNIIPIAGNLQQLAETYLAARIAPDAKTAVKMASDYMQKSVVQVNNTLYMASDLPPVPSGENGVKWFEQYQKDVLIPRLNKMGIDPDVSNLTLIPQKGGQSTYIVANKAQPLPSDSGAGLLMVNGADISSWVREQMVLRNQRDAEEANIGLRMKQKAQPPKVVTTEGGAAMVFRKK